VDGALLDTCGDAGSRTQVLAYPFRYPLLSHGPFGYRSRFRGTHARPV
jgi:hypothetical protein